MASNLLRNKRAVIFDVGNTLTTPDWERISTAAGNLNGYHIEHSELQRRMTAILRRADSDPEFIKSLSENAVRTNWHFRWLFSELGMADDQQANFADDLDQLHREKHLWTRLNDDVVEVLTELRRRGYKLGAISNSEDGRIEDILRVTDLLPLFDVYLDSFLVGYTKPDPRIFLMATDTLGLSHAEAAFVGDSYGQDIVGAKNAGLQPVLFDPLGSRPDADVPIIRSLKDLL